MMQVMQLRFMQTYNGELCMQVCETFIKLQSITFTSDFAEYVTADSTVFPNETFCSLSEFFSHILTCIIMFIRTTFVIQQHSFELDIFKKQVTAAVCALLAVKCLYKCFIILLSSSWRDIINCMCLFVYGNRMYIVLLFVSLCLSVFTAIQRINVFIICRLVYNITVYVFTAADNTVKSSSEVSNGPNVRKLLSPVEDILKGLLHFCIYYYNIACIACKMVDMSAVYRHFTEFYYLCYSVLLLDF